MYSCTLKRTIGIASITELNNVSTQNKSKLIVPYKLLKSDLLGS